MYRGGDTQPMPTAPTTPTTTFSQPTFVNRADRPDGATGSGDRQGVSPIQDGNGKAMVRLGVILENTSRVGLRPRRR